MARWRAEALRRLPEMRDVITSADSVMALWIELSLAFEKAYRTDPPDDSLIGRIYSFSTYCMQAPRGPDAGHDPVTAVLAFYEDIPTVNPARDDMPRWLPYAEVANNRFVFAYHIGDEKYDELVKHMTANRHRYQPHP